MMNMRNSNYSQMEIRLMSLLAESCKSELHVCNPMPGVKNVGMKFCAPSAFTLVFEKMAETVNEAFFTIDSVMSSEKHVNFGLMYGSSPNAIKNNFRVFEKRCGHFMAENPTHSLTCERDAVVWHVSKFDRVYPRCAKHETINRFDIAMTLDKDEVALFEIHNE